MTYKLPIKHTADYSGEHREWIVEYELPQWLVDDIERATEARVVAWLRANRRGLVDPWQSAADQIEQGKHRG